MTATRIAEPGRWPDCAVLADDLAHDPGGGHRDLADRLRRVHDDLGLPGPPGGVHGRRTWRSGRGLGTRSRMCDWWRLVVGTGYDDQHTRWPPGGKRGTTTAARGRGL